MKATESKKMQLQIRVKNRSEWNDKDSETGREIKTDE